MRELNENGVNLERIKGNEEPRSKYFIIPEGDKTEIQYFSGIKSNREDLNIKSLIEIIYIFCFTYIKKITVVNHL